MNASIPMNTRVDSKTLSGFESIGYKVANLATLYPKFSAIRIMMMPFHAHNVQGSLPETLNAYKPLLQAMIALAPKHVVFPEDATAYLTIDEMHLKPGAVEAAVGARSATACSCLRTRAICAKCGPGNFKVFPSTTANATTCARNWTQKRCTRFRLAMLSGQTD